MRYLKGSRLLFSDGMNVLHKSGVEANEITLIGGGSRSAYWRQMLADVLNHPLTSRAGGDVGPALGAARLALLGVLENADIQTVCKQPPLAQEHQPVKQQAKVYAERMKTFSALYHQLKDFF